MDGVIGLAPEIAGGPPNFVGSLKRNNSIDHKVFSIYIGVDQNEQSQIQFGGYDSFQLKKDDEDSHSIHWFQVQSQDYWIIDLHACLYGDGTINNGKEVEAVLDSGSAFIYLHTEDFNVLYQTWHQYIKGVQCSSQICFFEGVCSQLEVHLKDLKFRFNDDWYFVLPPS